MVVEGVVDMFRGSLVRHFSLKFVESGSIRGSSIYSKSRRLEFDFFSTHDKM